eukprot:jgi/Mesvir1/24233/Mv10940-RA.4
MQANECSSRDLTFAVAPDSLGTDMSAECRAPRDVAVRIVVQCGPLERQAAATAATQTDDWPIANPSAFFGAVVDAATQTDSMRADPSLSPREQETLAAPHDVNKGHKAPKGLLNLGFKSRKHGSCIREFRSLGLADESLRPTRNRKRPAFLADMEPAALAGSKQTKRRPVVRVMAPPPPIDPSTPVRADVSFTSSQPAESTWAVVCVDDDEEEGGSTPLDVAAGLPGATTTAATPAHTCHPRTMSAGAGGYNTSQVVRCPALKRAKSNSPPQGVLREGWGVETRSTQGDASGRASSPPPNALALPDVPSAMNCSDYGGGGCRDAGASGGGQSASQEVQQALATFNRIYLEMAMKENERVAEAMTKKPWLDMKARADKKKKNKEARPPNLNPLGKRLKTPTGAVHKRPDLCTMGEMIKQRLCVNHDKRIGEVPGIPVGQTFVYRAELAVVGLHSHWLAGIDVICAQKSRFKKTIAISCVMSGGYSGDRDDGEVVIYTGAGGQNSSSKHISGQKMAGANVALKNNIETKSPVRLIRGRPDESTSTKKVYTYDGLYQVMRTWSESLPEHEGGHLVYKFELRRVKGQAPLSEAWVSYLRGSGPAPKKEGLILRDLSQGAERFPIPVINTVDDTGPPNDFEYITESVLPRDIAPQGPLPTGCACASRARGEGQCRPGKCECIQKNPSGVCYIVGKSKHPQLTRAVPVIYECGPQCGCPPSCGNRVTQQGLQYPLELFRTKHKGWGVRSSSYIQSGGLVCRMTGVVLREDESELLQNDRYLIQLDLLETMQRGRGGAGSQKKSRGSPSSQATETIWTSEGQDGRCLIDFCLDGGPKSNVSRFLNHR